ncbi:MAG TPA: LD-carboxypeptidase [Vicinamibacteria bacterium]|nr:LD-carboxypeptidase [Vicinamibacteria bacterium]
MRVEPRSPLRRPHTEAVTNDAAVAPASPLTLPPRLAPGSTIGIAAVSRPPDPERLGKGVDVLERLGYAVVLASNIGARHGPFAGTDAQRGDGYRELLRDPRVDAIFFARGGYGASRILARLDVAEIRTRPVIHLGGSDLTALFAFIGRHAELTTFYGPMVAVDMTQPPPLDWEAVLSGQTPAPHRSAPENVHAGGVGSGPLVGGCLSLLAAACGTPEAVVGRGAVLFWEDVGEDTYRLDRMLTQLERSGTFDGLQAMLIGSISPGTRGGESPEAVGLWLRDFFAGAPFPVLSGFPAGHLPGPRTLPLGAPVHVDAERGLVEFSGPAVAGAR